MFKLALKNLTSKPLRAVVTVLAIAVAVAMIFAMLSFSPAVYEYIYSTQTATSGASDIIISTNSTSDRIIDTIATPLEGLDGVEAVCPSLTLYALLNGEYVQMRGFSEKQSNILQEIVTESGDKSQLDENIDNIVISNNAAKSLGLNVGDRVSLTLGGQNANFYVCAIAEKSGYFLNDAPFLFVGRVEGISRLLAGIQSRYICNEIYVKVQSGYDVDKLIDEISSMPAYSSMLVSRTGGKYIEEQANSLSAPVVLAGIAVFALAIAIVVLLFMMSEGEKISLISKYSVIGATKKQIAGVFLTESVMLAALGAVIGSVLAVGVFVGILKLTLSSTILFSISAWRLFLSAIIGLVSAIVSSIVPILRSFKGTIRQNQIGTVGNSKLTKILCPVLILLTVISVIVEFAVPSATVAMSVVSLVLALATLGVSISSVLRGVAFAGGKLSQPVAKVASLDLRRDGRFAKSVTMLGVGMTISIMLFMAWSMTQSIFSDYISDFSNLIFVTNVQSSVNADVFKDVDGVKDATKIVWQQGSLKGDGFDKTMNILGTENALDIVDFEFVTPRERVEELLRINNSDETYVFLDYALSVLYGVNEGDTLSMTLDKKTVDVKVGGILSHRLFSGNYIVISEKAVQEQFGVGTDTVVVKVDKNVKDIVNALRAQYANNNYYVVDVLTAYKWEMQSTNAVFDLIGTLAVVVAIFIFATTVFATYVGRETAKKSRYALLNAGMSKRSLLMTEVTEHLLIALVSYVLSFAFSVLLAACLIHALRLFGFYFEFMYRAWVAGVVGAAMGIGYTLVPVVFNFKRRYTVKR